MLIKFLASIRFPFTNKFATIPTSKGICISHNRSAFTSPPSHHGKMLLNCIVHRSFPNHHKSFHWPANHPRNYMNKTIYKNKLDTIAFKQAWIFGKKQKNKCVYVLLPKILQATSMQESRDSINGRTGPFSVPCIPRKVMPFQ